MNEISNFRCETVCNPDTDVPDTSVQFKLFYQPGGVDLNEKAVPVDAKHSDGTLEFESHSSFGHLEGIATKKYIESTGDQRSFILSRSTILGSAKYTQHWLGDNWSTFEYMKASVAGIFNFNLFGFSIVGADICGFLGNT